jgi:undecaprenyl-diphosphatase
MQFLYFLEDLRVPGLNEFFLLITKLGEETAFLALALVFFWCVDKRRGYYLMAVGFTGTILNQMLKLTCRVPRPWMLDPEFTILEQAREAAAGYSFPSGHTTSAVGTFGSLAATSRQKRSAAIYTVLALLVGFSRMYIGVHTPADVIVGALTSLVLIVLLRKVPWKGRAMNILVIVMMAASLGLLAFVQCYPFPADVDAHNLESGLRNGWTLVGCMAGVGVVYAVEKRYVNFTTAAVWWAQVLKVVLGLALVLLVKEGLRSPLEAIFGNPYPARAVRYFLIVVVAGVFWPVTFRWFYTLGKNREGIK